MSDGMKTEYPDRKTGPGSCFAEGCRFYGDADPSVIIRILEKISEFDRIIICRHRRPDGDATGASGGLCELIRAAFPEKKVMISNREKSAFAAFIEADSDTPSEDDYPGSLVIAVDTSVTERLSDDFFGRAAFLIKIDHHIDVAPYGDLSWVDEDRSSCCEMIAELSRLSDGKLPMTKRAAEMLFTGLVTDSDRFKFLTGPCLFDTAAYLASFGIDTERIYANLYLKEFGIMKFHAEMTSRIRRTKEGVAYLFVTEAMKKEYSLDMEEASAVISLMDKIKGCPVWIAFIDDPEGGSVRVRLRSRFVPVSGLAEKFGGGGHEFAAGAKVFSEEEAEELISEASRLVAAYKAENPDVI